MGERLVWDTEPLPNPALPTSHTKARGERQGSDRRHRTAERQSLASHELIAERLSAQTVAKAKRTLEDLSSEVGSTPR